MTSLSPSPPYAALHHPFHAGRAAALQAALFYLHSAPMEAFPLSWGGEDWLPTIIEGSLARYFLPLPADRRATTLSVQLFFYPVAMRKHAPKVCTAAPPVEGVNIGENGLWGWEI